MGATTREREWATQTACVCDECGGIRNSVASVIGIGAWQPQHPVLGNSVHDDKIDDLERQSHLQQSFYSHAHKNRDDKLEQLMRQTVEGARAVTLAPPNPTNFSITFRCC